MSSGFYIAVRLYDRRRRLSVVKHYWHTLLRLFLPLSWRPRHLLSNTEQTHSNTESVWLCYTINQQNVVNGAVIYSTCVYVWS